MAKSSNRRIDTQKYPKTMRKRYTSSTPSLEESIVSRDRQVYDHGPQKMKGEPVVIRNIAKSSGDLVISNGLSGGLYSNGTIPVRIFLSAPDDLSLLSSQTKPEYLEYDSNTRSKLQKLDLMISRIDRANECILKGIPTYLPEGDSAPRRITGHFGGYTFENARKEVASKQLMRRKKYSMKQDFDSESDNFNNKAYGGELHQIGFTRFRRQNYAPYSASHKVGLQPESSSASSSAEEAELDDYLHREKVTSPRVRPPKGGKVRPTSPGEEHNVQDYTNGKESMLLPTQPAVPEPSVPEPITSPFDTVPPNPMEENNNGLEIAMNDLPYSESVGNLLGISRNGSAVGFFLGETQQPTTFDLA